MPRVPTEKPAARIRNIVIPAKAGIQHKLVPPTAASSVLLFDI